MKVIKRENIENIDFFDEGYQFLWLQEYGRVELGTVEGKTIDYSRLIEARVFSRDKELYIFEDDGIQAVETVYEEGDDCFEETQLLRGRFGRQITLRHYVGYEEDGQAYVARTVVCDYKAV